MRSIQTHQSVPLAAVKPLEPLLDYRRHCIAATHAALRGQVQRRARSPVGDTPLEPCGDVEGLPYARCPETGSLFVAQLPPAQAWAQLLADMNRYRHSPAAFHQGLSQSRADHVYTPKLEWVEETLRLQSVYQPRVLEVTTPPSDFTEVLRSSGDVAEILTADETQCIRSRGDAGAEPADVAVLLESLDRAHDPAALIQAVAARLVPGGLLFVTALVASGFDLAVLGLQNLYLYPPDRTNCFSLQGLTRLLERQGLTLLEVSTPGALDVEIVRAHLQRTPTLNVSSFERQIAMAASDTQAAFQAFLQERGLSSFARLVARKP